MMNENGIKYHESEISGHVLPFELSMFFKHNNVKQNKQCIVY